MKRVVSFFSRGPVDSGGRASQGEAADRRGAHEPRQGQGHVRAQGHRLCLHGLLLVDADGSITIDVTSSNRHGKLLDGQTGVQLTVGPNTKIRLKNGVTSIAAAQPGDLGTVKVRASRLHFKSATLADVQSALVNQPAHMATDWGPAS